MRSSIRRLSSIWLAFLLCVLVAAPALAAKPFMETIDLDNPDDEAFYSELFTSACGAPIAADIWGSVRIKVFTDQEGNFKRQINKWFIRIRLTNTETGTSILIKDVGPDILWLDKNGDLLVAITGRSVTGSGVIGRVVVNLTTNEVVSESGKPLGDWVENGCGALT
ncbi:MAG TPA: hypothetical protein VMP67_12920 [Candidatus Limnocylindria bacterium]|nr:hypothetical protein [Candidatus Limnocylindria bacterium]